MLRPVRAFATVAGSAVGLAACTVLFGGDLPEVGVAAPPDANAFADAGTDVGAGLADAGPDALDAGDTGAPRGCSSFTPPPKFCRDFDDEGPVDTGWDRMILESSTIERDTSIAYSGRASARVRMVDAPFCSYGRLQEDFLETGRTKLDLRFRYRPAPSTATHYPFVVDLPGRCSILLILTGNAGALDAARVLVQVDGVTSRNIAIDGVAASDKWTEIGLTATRAATADADAGISVRFAFRGEDGKEVASDRAFPECKALGSAGLRLGFHCHEGDAEGNFDDVRVDWE